MEREERLNLFTSLATLSLKLTEAVWYALNSLCRICACSTARYSNRLKILNSTGCLQGTRGSEGWGAEVVLVFLSAQNVTERVAPFWNCQAHLKSMPMSTRKTDSEIVTPSSASNRKTGWLKVYLDSNRIERKLQQYSVRHSVECLELSSLITMRNLHTL